MNLHTLSTTAAAVAGLLLAVAPAMAETNYHTESTPAERVETNTLNTNAADRARSDSDANAAAQADYDAARAAYERSLNRYDVRKAVYEDDRARFESERRYYERNRAQRWRAFHNRDRYREILAFRSDELIGKQVSTRTGRWIGRIRDVDFTPQGQVNRIAIQVDRRRIAWVYADDVRYDPSMRVILIDLSRDQLDMLARLRETGA